MMTKVKLDRKLYKKWVNIRCLVIYRKLIGMLIHLFLRDFGPKKTKIYKQYDSLWSFNKV